VWDATSSATTRIYEGHSGRVNRVAWSRNGKLLASASNDNTVRVWDPVSGTTLFIYNQHFDRVMDVAWSPDGKQLASADAANISRVWLWS
jgi:WD40 repeat protein